VITQAEAVAWLLGDSCQSCAARLPGPGQPCGSCGQIPSTTEPEIAAQLDGPVALAAVESAKLRHEAWALYDAAVAKMSDADEAMFTAGLQVGKNQAQAALDEHQRQHKSLYGPRAAARKAEAKVAAELASSAAEHERIARAEEIARRMRYGLAAETDAALRLDKASAVLGEYKARLGEATACREAAERAFDKSVAVTERLEKERDAAVARLTNPGRIPRSGETIGAGLLRMLLRGQLDEVEMVTAGEIGRMICAATGATDAIVAEARGDLLREQEAEKQGQPVRLRPMGDGSVGAFPNPRSSPQPYDAPRFPPHPVQPSTRPGWH
jgi:hypothetical protein